MKSTTLFFLIVLLLPLTVTGQKQDSITQPVHQIAMIARPTEEGKILLRWAPTTRRAWKALNTNAYELTRYTVIINNEVVSSPEIKRIGRFRPAPLTEWMEVIDTNNNAAIMAQAMYGEDFDVSGQDKLAAIINLAEEQQQRFTWALYAADLDFQVAIKAGLGFVDNTVKENEKYLYKIKPATPTENFLIEEGGVFIGLKDYEPLPPPLDISSVFLNGSVLLSWNYKIYKTIYNNYIIEKSEDSLTFYQLNNLPLANFNANDKKNRKQMLYKDSITNDKMYYYRVRGMTSFGEISPPSKVVSGQGKTVLAYVPRIKSKDVIDENSVILEWEFLEEGNEHISGFELNRGNLVDEDHQVVIKNIPATARKIQYDSLKNTNYFTLTAVGKNGGTRTSFPVLVQPIDSTPPLHPTGLMGNIDSLGIVTLNWNTNKEEDMLGYRVFRGYQQKEEFSQITVSPHQGTQYYDSVSLESLNGKVFYLLVAVDKRYNMSDFSDTLVLKKPDIIPPTMPTFYDYELTDEGIKLEWTNSSSSDVVKYEIYKRSNFQVSWSLIHTVPILTNLDTSSPSSTSTWTDTKIAEGTKNSYTIIAIDESGLESTPAPPIVLTMPTTSLKPPLKGLGAYVDKNNGFIELFWKPYEEPKVSELMIYKGMKDQPLSLFRNVLPTVTRIVDDNVKPNNEYSYTLRAIFEDGSMSEASELNVKF